MFQQTLGKSVHHSVSNGTHSRLTVHHFNGAYLLGVRDATFAGWTVNSDNSQHLVRLQKTCTVYTDVKSREVDEDCCYVTDRSSGPSRAVGPVSLSLYVPDNKC